MDFEGIYQSYCKDVFRYLRSLSAGEDLAEEITQETFFKALKALDSFRGQCRLYVWLCQIARHCWYDHLKRQRRRPALSLEELTQAGEEPAGTGDDLPEISLLRRDDYVSAHKAIHSLREPYREIFLLRTLSELSFREIGEVFGRTENWARVTYYRAKTMLVQKLEE